MSWSLPINLKGKLSDAWTKCLEMLANSSSFHSATSSFLTETVSNADDSENAIKSWEPVLSILGEEEAVEDNGELKLVPIFSSLPLALQLRFIFFLRSNISRVCNRSAKQFLGKIENCQKNEWTKEAACQLRNDIARLKAETNQPTEEWTVTKYAFTSESQNALKSILSNLTDGKFEPWQKCSASTKLEQRMEVAIGDIVESKNTEGISGKSSYSISSLYPTIKNKTSSLTHTSEKTTDIIIIDDDSSDYETAQIDHSSTKTVDNTANKFSNNFNTLTTCTKVVKEKQDSAHCSNVLRSDSGNNKQPTESECISTSNKTVSIKQATVISDKQHAQAPEYPSVDSSQLDVLGVQNLKANRKKKFTEIQIETGGLLNCPVAVKKTSTNVMEADEDLAVEVKSEASAEMLFQFADSKPKLSGSVMLHLDIIREACSSKDNALVKVKDLMNCFLEMKIAEIKMACTYLDLPRFSENALVSFCDSMPWTSLGNELSIVLLDSCFGVKLTNLECQASRTLLMSLDSVSRVQPKALINVLAHILQVAHSGEFQCQIFASACKDFLPPEYFGHILRQLSVEGPVVNEHLVSVLQTLLDKGADMDTDSLNYFHSLLVSGCQEISSSAKFGKLLMAVLRKYLKKMSSQQIITICALVESHNSSFRKQLQALIKRCT